MKILTAQQLREADAYTIQQEPIASIDLMERAAAKCAEWITHRFDASLNFILFCGAGNNGGDGLAIARMLYRQGYNVDVYSVVFSEKKSEDFSINSDRLKQLNIPVKEIRTKDDIPPLKEKDIIIDAIFGTGLSRPAEGIAAEVTAAVNQRSATVLSIDVPSGLFTEDNSGNNLQHIIRAAYTLTFEAPKLAFLLPATGDLAGEWHILDIGLSKGFIGSLKSTRHYITADDVKAIYKKRGKFSHKGTFGHALLVAGSYGKMGAAVLAAKACLRAGAGLLTVHIPKAGYDIMQTAVPEAMVIADADEKLITEKISHQKYSSIGIGPGIGTDALTQSVLKSLIQNAAAPLVIDADALNILSENKTWLSYLPKDCILTPHPKEFKRLAGKASGDMERIDLLKEFAFKKQAYVVLKGAHTVIASPGGQLFFNSTGTPGMATAGSGDVLTGILTGLLAQGYSTFEAAVLGVYLHGRAGDIAARELSEEALTAGDIVTYLGEAFKEAG